MPSRDRGRAKARSSDEEFVLFLQGIPAYCRWQELKDMVRQTALHIRQAVVYDDQHGFPTGLGQIIVKNEDEAWRTYHRLSTNGWDGQSLVVTLARTSSPTSPVAGPTKSPCAMPPTYVAGYSTPPQATQNLAIPPSPISPASFIAAPAYQGPEYGPVLSPMIPPPHYHQLYMPIFTEQLPSIPHSPALQHSFCDPHAPTILPTYPILPIHEPLTPTPIPLNNTNNNRKPNPQPYGPYHPPRPHKRTIFIQNLNPTTTSTELVLFLQDAGSIEYCEMPLNRDTGRSKGFARVTFQTAEEAKRAVALYNAAFFLSAKIRVRIDRGVSFARGHGHAYGCDVNGEGGRLAEKTTATATAPGLAVDRCQPLVVNGSVSGGKTVQT